MRTLLCIILFCGCAALAEEILLSDDERTKQSTAVFTGTVVSTNFLRELKSGALCSAQIRVESIEKAHTDLKTNAIVYFEQTYSVDDKRGFHTHGRTCPDYPEIVVGQKIKLWCVRWTVEGHTNVLFVRHLIMGEEELTMSPNTRAGCKS